MQVRAAVHVAALELLGRRVLDRPDERPTLGQPQGLVGAGISVYTAFLAFGAVRLMPELALNPALWAVPLVTGVPIILYHWRKIGLLSTGLILPGILLFLFFLLFLPDVYGSGGGMLAFALFFVIRRRRR